MGEWRIVRRALGRRVVENARRRLWLEVVRNGLTRADLDRFHAEKCWWPSIRDDPALLALERALPADLREGGDLCEPQILMHFPDEALDWPLVPHLDQPPPWADGRPYLRIVAVPLTEWDGLNGGLRFYSDGERDGYAPPLHPGDVAVFDGATPHSGGLNRSGDVRIGLYFRYLAAA